MLVSPFDHLPADVRAVVDGYLEEIDRIRKKYAERRDPLTDVIDKSFLRGSAIFSPGARATAWRRAGREVRALPRSLYRRTSVAAPVRTFFGPCGFQPVTKRA